MQKTLLINLLLCATLTACGGGGGSSSSSDTNKDDVVDTPDTTNPDITPDAFTFSELSNQNPSSNVTSSEITLSGMDNGTSISIEGGQYSLNGADFTASAGTANTGDSVAIRLTTSNDYQTATSAILTVGTESSTFTATTRSKDISPDEFSFASLTNVELSSDITSNEVTLSGIDDDVAISTTQGFYKINNGDYTSQAGSVNNGDKVTLLLNSGSDYASNNSAKLTVGDYTATFTLSTRERDETPDEVVFESQNNVEPSTLITSNAVTVSGIDDDMNVSITNGKLSVNGSEFSTSGTLNNGDVLAVQVMSADDYESQTQANITLGTATVNFSVTTRQLDTMPDAFTFTPIEDAELYTEYTSNTITLQGFDGELDIDVDGGQYSLNNGPFIGSDGKVKSGDTLTLSGYSFNQYETEDEAATIYVGAFSADFIITTRKKDTNPSYTSPGLGNDVPLNTRVESNPITFSNFDGDDVTISGAQYKLNDGEWTDAGSTYIESGDVLTLRVLSANTYTTQVSASVGGSGWLFVYRVTTLEDTAPTAILNKSLLEDGSTPLNPNEELVLTFSETMQTNTLALGGDILPCTDLEDESTCQVNVTWSDDDTVLTLSPKDGFYWYSDVRSLEISVVGDGPLGLDKTYKATVLPVFETFQAADVVIGQENFTDRSIGTSNVKLNNPSSISFYEEGHNSALLITDANNARIVALDSIPNENGAEFAAVFGQLDFESNSNGLSANKLYRPTGAMQSGTKVYVADAANSRGLSVDISNFSNTGSAEGIIGQADFDSKVGECNNNSLSYIQGMDVLELESGTQWIVSDQTNHRIMIWDNYTAGEGEDANLVLGQPSFEECDKKYPESHGLNGLSDPRGVWSNGEKLIVVDSGSNRLLVWNTFPTASSQSPDFQLGQKSDFLREDNYGEDSTNQFGFKYPTQIGGNRHQICVADTYNNRILLWSTTPESNDDLPDVVIGQSNFEKGTANDTDQDGVYDAQPDARTLSSPKSCDMSYEQLFIMDALNHRALIYNALNKRPE